LPVVPPETPELVFVAVAVPEEEPDVPELEGVPPDVPDPWLLELEVFDGVAETSRQQPPRARIATTSERME
jgi:hypothetical protein